MPKIKVDRITSFSTEDPIHEARNILSNDPSKKWKCQKEGEKSASIVLQLEQASVISSIDIGNEHSAYVEVLVNRSSASDDYKVLLVMSSFMSPLESRQSTNVNKVRMFGYNELQSPERDQKWDRVKIVCTQPFNRRIQYGLSFITLHTPEGKDSVTSNTPVKLGKFSLRPESPDNLTTGSLFARRKELADDTPRTAAAAIREASSSSTLNSDSPKCKPRLKETKVTPSKQNVSSHNNQSTSRNRDELLYSKDEEEVNEKIDKLIEQKNKETKEKREKEEEANEKKLKQSKESKEKRAKEKETKNNEKKLNQSDKNSTSINSKQDKKQEKHSHGASGSSSQSSNNKQNTNTNKRKTNEDNVPTTSKKIRTDKQTKPFNRLLEGVTIVISGIQNPERADIRSNALEMGAKYKGDWDNSSTHLICAFTNTPKYNQVRGKGKIVNRMWVPDCYTERKRLPWRRYALDPKELSANESEDEIWEEKKREKSPEVEVLYIRENGDNDDDDDTDPEMEIDKLMALNKAKDRLSQSDFTTDTDEENIKPQKTEVIPHLPNFLDGKIIYIDTNLSEKNRFLLARYIVAFNGTVLDTPIDVDFIISSPQSAETLKEICPNACIVKPEWILECHNENRFIPPEDYEF